MHRQTKLKPIVETTPGQVGAETVKYLFGSDHPLTPNERRLVLRAFVAIAIPMAMIVLLTGAITVALLRQNTNNRITDNKAAIQRETALQQQFNRRIAHCRLRSVCRQQRSEITSLLQQLEVCEAAYN